MINSNTSLLDAALHYASQGFAVFPTHIKIADGVCSCNNPNCKSVGKHPRVENGLKDATTDPKIINYWWNNVFRGSGVAIVTGRKSGFFVVDVDVKELGLQAWETFKDDHQLDDYSTVVQQTPSGGRHIMYKMPEEGHIVTKTNVIAKGIDIRGDGGYIVAAPSAGYHYLIDQGFGEIELEEADESILELALKKEFEPKAELLAPTALFDMFDSEIEKIRSALNVLDYDDYSLWWSVGAALHSTNGKQAFQLWCEWSEQSSKYSLAAQQKAWQDYEERKGTTKTSIELEYIYKQASGEGWAFFEDHSDVNIDPNITNEEFQQMRKEIEANKERPCPPPFVARNIPADFSPISIPVREWLIKDYLLKGYINLLIAPGATGKSALTIVEAISIATGRNLLNLGSVNKGKVLLINNEDDDDELDRRISAICELFSIPINELKDSLFIRSGYGSPVLISNEINKTVVRSPELESLVQFVKCNAITLVTLDPFVSTHQSNENDNSNIDAVVQHFKHIAKSTGAAIRLVHHTRKTGPDGITNNGDIELARGASSLKDAARVGHTLAKMDVKTAKQSGIDSNHRGRLIRLDNAKTNFSPPSESAHWFQLESVRIANGEYIGVPKPFSITLEPEKKESVESKKAMVIHSLGLAALEVLGPDGGAIKGTKIRDQYMILMDCGKSKANSDFQLLPMGQLKSQRIHLKGKYYRIFQTKKGGLRDPRYIHLTPEE